MLVFAENLFSIITGFLIALAAIIVFEVVRRPKLEVRLLRENLY